MNYRKMFYLCGTGNEEGAVTGAEISGDYRSLGAEFTIVMFLTDSKTWSALSSW